MLGSELNPKILRGEAKDTSHKRRLARPQERNVYLNFVQYGLHHRLVDLVCADFGKSPFRVIKPWLDAIITDRMHSLNNFAIWQEPAILFLIFSSLLFFPFKSILYFPWCKSQRLMGTEKVLGRLESAVNQKGLQSTENQLVCIQFDAPNSSVILPMP